MDKDSPDKSFTIPDSLPLLPIRDAVVFPSMILPLFVGRDVSVQAIETALEGDRLLALATQRDPEIEDPGPDDLYSVGTVGMIMRLMRLPDDRLKVLVQGLSKIKIVNFLRTEPFIEVEVEELPVEEAPEWTVEVEALIRSVSEKIATLLPLRHLPPELLSITANVEDPGRLADLVAANLRLRVDEAQETLEIVDPVSRLRRVESLLLRELPVSSMQVEFQTSAREEMNRTQREVLLREQMRQIQEELGEGDDRSSEI